MKTYKKTYTFTGTISEASGMLSGLFNGSAVEAEVVATVTEEVLSSKTGDMLVSGKLTKATSASGKDLIAAYLSGKPPTFENYKFTLAGANVAGEVVKPNAKVTYTAQINEDGSRLDNVDVRVTVLNALYTWMVKSARLQGSAVCVKTEVTGDTPAEPPVVPPSDYFPPPPPWKDA